MTSVFADPTVTAGKPAVSLRLMAGRAGPDDRVASDAGAAASVDAAAPVGSGAPADADFSALLVAIGNVAARARIHALHPARFGDEGAATGFALCLLSHLAAVASEACRLRRMPRPILWIQDGHGRREAGRPYGLGISAFGLDPAQFVIVSTKTALEALAATEIGLEIGGLDGVIAELPPNLPADMLALGKRLSLRSERSATPCLLLHARAEAVPAPVATRWLIASRPAVANGAWAEPLPVADLSLIKNRFGPTGRWSVPLKGAALFQGVSDVRVSTVSTTVSQSVDAYPANRSGTSAQRSPSRSPRRSRAA